MSKVKDSIVSRHIKASGIDLKKLDESKQLESFTTLIDRFNHTIVQLKEENTILDNALLISNKEVKNYISELEKKNNSLHLTSRLSALGEMAGGIAHEINNPLAIIAGFSKILELEVKKEEINKTLLLKIITDLSKNTKRVQTIIEGMRSLSRNEGTEISNFSFTELINPIVSILQERFSSSQTKFIIDTECDLIISGNFVQISQVLLNLINNSYAAVKHLDEKVIQVNAVNSSDYSIIEVLDSGRGIPKDIESMIFTPFYTTKGIGEGTGLGLSISRNIIEGHKGYLYYELKDGNTCFKIKLPKVKL